jgi:hypothetical protein
MRPGRSSLVRVAVEAAEADLEAVVEEAGEAAGATAGNSYYSYARREVDGSGHPISGCFDISVKMSYSIFTSV